MADIQGVNPRLQSPYIYLQAAGSDGSDNTAEGIHLRWALQRRLGETHLPKGILSGLTGRYRSTVNFNRDKDFVNIYKTEYNPKAFVAEVDLQGPANHREEQGPTRSWRYLTHPNPNAQAGTEVIVTFADRILYDSIRAQIRPDDDPTQFLIRYDGILTISTTAKHMLRTCFSFERMGDSIMQGEAISVRDRAEPDDRFLACRKKAENTEQLCLTCEDMVEVRLRYRNCFPFNIQLQTYEDYIQGVWDDPVWEWRAVGTPFSLSEDAGVVERALRNIPHDNIDGRWPKYHDADVASGRKTVNTDNYMDRWNQPEGLAFAVQRYLSLSINDPLASDRVQDNTTQPNDAAMEISYLDLLNVVAQDYHVARMLGLGTIDADPNTNGTKYVYLMEYITAGSLEEGQAARTVTHYYLTPPVTERDYRLPPLPELQGLRYGLFSQDEGGNRLPLTDEDGYTRIEPTRFVNLDRAPFVFEDEVPPFWRGDPGYCLCESTLPALYGVAYRRQGEPDWRRPEISHDPNYRDRAGLAETVPTPEVAENPVFVHREIEEGVHEYALYSINWFSRISPLSPPRLTDHTRFPVLRTLEPPANFAVQLIQPEQPLLLTTAAEQDRLQQMQDLDKTLVRVTFDWDQHHHMAYQFADTAEFHFRTQPPLNLGGIIKLGAASIRELSDNRVQVTTGPGNVASVDPPLIRQPDLPAGLRDRFIGGRFVYEEKAYEILDVTRTGIDPIFILQKIRSATSTATDEPEQYEVRQHFHGPETPGKPFLAVENTNQLASWSGNLSRRVYLENFSGAHRVEIVGSAANDGSYGVTQYQQVFGFAVVHLDRPLQISAGARGNLVYQRRSRVLAADPGNGTVTVAGNLLGGPGGLMVGVQVQIFAAPENEGGYQVSAVQQVGNDTRITLAPAPGSAIASGYLSYVRRVPITNNNAQLVVCQADLGGDLTTPHREITMESDGSQTVHTIGGITKPADISELADVDDNGNTIANSHTGIFQITFTGYQLPDHVDPGVEWYRGTVRIDEDPANFPPVADPTYREPQRKTLNIWKIDRSGADLIVTAFDPTFDAGYDPNVAANPLTDYMPIRTGTPVEVNLHPGYRLYLTAEPGQGFEATAIMPIQDEGSRQTYMAARSLDTSLIDVASPFTPPVVLLARELTEPEQPGIPSGPLFATRPDYYGKGTYTFEVSVNRPFALIFYRGTQQAILDALYRPATVNAIRTALANLDEDDTRFDQDRWRDLANAETAADGRFKSYIPGGYRFPNPDNDRYTLPVQEPPEYQGQPVKPFLGSPNPGGIIDIVRDAIESAFVPLTREPLIYAHLAQGSITANRSPVTSDADGQRLLPDDPAYDPWPMAVRHPNGRVRFTDYTLDGASSERYFYFGVGMSNQMTVSQRSPVAGPITLVNSYPPEQPVVRTTTVQPADAAIDQPAAVHFELDPYPAVERVTRFRLYRTTHSAEAVSVRTMTEVKTVPVGEPLFDDFADLNFPPFGEELFYRVVALRAFTNERNETEYALSKPGELQRVRLVDGTVPPAPKLSFESDPPQPNPTRLPAVRLVWNQTAWRPRYHLYKMTRLGQWQKLDTIDSNDDTVRYDLATVNLGDLPKAHPDGRNIYHHFKAVTENSSGLLSREEFILTI